MVSSVWTEKLEVAVLCSSTVPGKTVYFWALGSINEKMTFCPVDSSNVKSLEENLHLYNSWSLCNSCLVWTQIYTPVLGPPITDVSVYLIHPNVSYLFHTTLVLPLLR